MASDRPVLYALFGLNRAGQILYSFLFVAGFAGFVAWTLLPAMRFSEPDERLFRAARHGDRAGIEQALESGAGVNDPSPLDGSTALFRAAAFGHAEVVRALLERGADPAYRSAMGQTALEMVTAVRREEKDAAAARALDDVAAVLRGSEKPR